MDDPVPGQGSDRPLMTPRLELRLRVESAGLVSLPWRERLGEWEATSGSIRTRHPRRAEPAPGPLRRRRRPAMGAQGDAAPRIGSRSTRSCVSSNAARSRRSAPQGVVFQPFEDTAVLVTEYLERSWQYRRLLMRVPTDMRKHRERLLDAIAALLVDLHRNGLYWGLLPGQHAVHERRPGPPGVDGRRRDRGVPPVAQRRRSASSTWTSWSRTSSRAARHCRSARRARGGVGPARCRGRRGNDAVPPDVGSPPRGTDLRPAGSIAGRRPRPGS